MADYQEEVLSNLLDLQAELRGEAHDAGTGGAERADAPAETVIQEGRPAARDVPARGEDESITVESSGLQVSVAPTSAAVNERLAALNARLSRLEQDLANVTGRIDGVEADVDAPEPEAQDVDARWRSFLDLQRIVADRLDRR